MRHARSIGGVLCAWAMSRISKKGREDTYNNFSSTTIDTPGGAGAEYTLFSGAWVDKRSLRG